MGITLHTLAPNPGATRKKKRVGRGRGTGNGKTSGRGQKGQKSRSGHHGARVGFEGGQMPMQRRLPKRGFKNPFRVEAHPVNLGGLAAHFSEAGAVVDIEAMRKAGLVPKKARVVKILGGGELAHALTVRAHRFSKSAAEKLAALGGAAEVIGASDTSSGSPADAAEPAPTEQTTAQPAETVQE